MVQVPTPPSSRPASESPDIEKKQSTTTTTTTTSVNSSTELLQSLDDLLEKYLHLLDRHQTLQAELGKQLSSGFLSLAHANYTSPAGRRYGADYYDDRMKATRKVLLQPSANSDKNLCLPEQERVSDEYAQPETSKHIFTIQPVSSSRPGEEDEQISRTENKNLKQSQTDTGSPEKEKTNNSGGDSNMPPPETDPVAPVEPKFSNKKFRSSDPITWYGILVPPSLRSAQKSFTDAVQGQVPELASVVAEMRAMEKEIDVLRSEMGQI